MLERLRKTVGVQYSRWHLRNVRNPVQEFTDFFRRSKSFLIVLPEGYEEAHIAGNSLKKLFDMLKDIDLTVVTSGIRGTVLSDRHHSHVVRLDRADLNRFFLPRKSVLRRICNRSYDVALDMNLDFQLHAAYICKASRAPFRVGILCPPGEHIFNVHLNLRPSQPPQQMYSQFIRCLAMF
jgi:hypothetical protein